MPLLLLFGVVAVALSAAVFAAPIVIAVVLIRAARSGGSHGRTDQAPQARSVDPRVTVP